VPLPAVILPFPEIDQAYVLIPAGAEYVFIEEGQTGPLAPVMEQTGKGLTVITAEPFTVPVQFASLTAVSV
jgi:hypothetical protein